MHGILSWGINGDTSHKSADIDAILVMYCPVYPSPESTNRQESSQHAAARPDFRQRQADDSSRLTELTRSWRRLVLHLPHHHLMICQVAPSRRLLKWRLSLARRQLIVCSCSSSARQSRGGMPLGTIDLLPRRRERASVCDVHPRPPQLVSPPRPLPFGTALEATAHRRVQSHERLMQCKHSDR